MKMYRGSEYHQETTCYESIVLTHDEDDENRDYSQDEVAFRNEGEMQDADFLESD